MLHPKDTDWLNRFKNRTSIYAVYETHFRPRDTCRLKVSSWRMIVHVNGNQEKVVVATLILHKIDFKIKTITRDTEIYYTIIKKLIQEEDIAIISIYVPNIGATEYIKQMLTITKRENRQ